MKTLQRRYKILGKQYDCILTFLFQTSKWHYFPYGAKKDRNSQAFLELKYYILPRINSLLKNVFISSLGRNILVDKAFANLNKDVSTYQVTRILFDNYV